MKSRFNAYKDRFLQLGYVIGAFASIWSVVVAIWLQFWNLYLLIVIPTAIVLFLMIISILAVLRTESTTRLFGVNDSLDIRKYLYRWINNGGRVVIWTRDMSWANDREMNELLNRKASDRELIICLPKEVEKSDELKQAGAEVIAFGSLDAPATSFTITNFERAGSRVAVGRPSGNLHIIQEFSQGEHPAFHMAEDLVRLVRERKYGS